MSFQIHSIPLALYIHIPWCIKKCPYCDFNSHTLGSTVDFAGYVDALIADINSQLPLLQDRTISSIFIGGGTPSLLPIAQYQRLFRHMRTVLPLADDIEVTMEANPGTLEHAPFVDYLAVGINRLSIGVQTFCDELLQVLGRIHQGQQAVDAIGNARKAGFERLNVDLMHGLPKQTTSQAIADIKHAINAGATHLSWYQLTIEPNTVFYRNTPVLPEEDRLADIEMQGRQMLVKQGFANYEISAWVSQEDVACQHNMNYWQFGDYLAIGAGAHGKVTVQNVAGHADAIYRFSKSRLPKDYVTYPNAPKMVSWQAIAEDELASEFMLNALRLTHGIPMALFTSRTGLADTAIASTMAHLKNKQLLVDHPKIIKPTSLGRQYLNQVMQAFI